MKTCSKCKEYKNLKEFHKNSTKPDGLQNICKLCSNQRTKSHYENNKQYYIKKAKESYKRLKKWFVDYKKNLYCETCGEKDFRCLDFHHVDPLEKDIEVSLMIVKFGKTKILNEIKKCKVLCSNCHRKFHYQEVC